MQTNDSKMSKKRLIFDAILILAILVLALSALIIVRAFSTPGSVAVVKIDGEELMRVSLDSYGEYSLLDGANILVVEDGEAYIKSADCPDRLCVKQGRVSRSGETIICLPNRLSITVE